ncbi:MAG: DEAD/DEAH box helicase, partial [Verrucomicrobia bacterium]|nr:DEAD/DEAH box helicase [Verrucomicrobiota bacterium]
MSPTSASPLDMPLARLWGVGPERGAQLARLGLHTIGDLLLHRPRRHEDRRHFLAIRDLRLGQAATTRGRIVAQGLKTYRKETRSVFEFILDDGTARLHCRWWNLPFMEKYFKVGDDVMVFGKPKALKPRTMDHPETEVVVPGEEMSIHLDRVVPVYPLTEGLPQRWLRSLMWRTLGEWEKQLVEPWPELMLSPSPARAQAIHCLHFPGELDQAELARQRLALDELIELQIRIQTRRRKLQANARGLPCAGDNHLIKPFLGRLGFTLTESQTAVLREIRKDMGGLYPMRRLLQGDVGSGKTVVAACTALMALESGCNAALMAPTEILAEQHFKNFTRWFDPLGLRVELQTGSTKTLNTKDSLLFSPATLGIPAPSKQTEPLPNPLTRPEGSLSPS